MTLWEIIEPFVMLFAVVLGVVLGFSFGIEYGREKTLDNVQSTLRYLLYRSGKYDDISDQLMQDIRDGVSGNTPPRRP